MPKRKSNLPTEFDCDKLYKNSTRNNIFINGSPEIKDEPLNNSFQKFESQSTTVESLQSDLSEFQNDDSFSVIKNQINLLGSNEPFYNSDLLEQIMAKLNDMDDKIGHMKTEFCALKRLITGSNKSPNSHNVKHSDDPPVSKNKPNKESASNNESIHFNKCQSVDEILEFSEKLQNKEEYSKMLAMCSTVGGNDEYECTYRILKLLTRKDILGRMNKTGTFNKTKFPKVLLHLIYESASKNFNCTFAEIEKAVGRVLHNCIPNAKKSFLKY